MKNNLNFQFKNHLMPLLSSLDLFCYLKPQNFAVTIHKNMIVLIYIIRNPVNSNVFLIKY